MIKVSKNLVSDNNNTIVIGTHNGIFHCDEVVATAIMALLFDKMNIAVIRSRDLDYLNQNCNFLIDIGGKEFDHHQKGGNGERSNGIKYASAGLVWKKFGIKVITRLKDNNFQIKEIDKIKNNIDLNVIQYVDMEDNGQLETTHPFSFITSFLPSWYSDISYDKKFEECVNIVKDVLKNIIESYIALYLAQKEIYVRIASINTHPQNILELPCQNIPWVDILIDYNNNCDDKIDFVVFPYPNGGYALQCVPPSFDNKFGQRIKLPESWAGETTQLPEISGCLSATFCHNGRFFARANKYEDIIKMCKIATQLAKDDEQKLVLEKKD